MAAMPGARPRSPLEDRILRPHESDPAAHPALAARIDALEAAGGGAGEVTQAELDAEAAARIAADQAEAVVRAGADAAEAAARQAADAALQVDLAAEAVARAGADADLQAELDLIFVHEHTQAVASDAWVVNHGASIPPAAILVLDEAGETRHPEIQHDTPAAGQATLAFTTPIAGRALVHSIGTPGNGTGGGGGGGGGVTDHGALTGLADNDHPQYLLQPSALTAATEPLADADLMVVSQGGTAKRTTVAALRAVLGAIIITGGPLIYSAPMVLDEGGLVLLGADP